MKEAFVYILWFCSSGVFYVGSTYDPARRMDRHLYHLRAGDHHNSILQDRWIPGESVSLTTISHPDRESAFRAEEDCIAKFKASPLGARCCNIGKHARGGDNLTYHPERQRILDNRQGSLSHLPEAVRIQRYGRPGSQNGMFGKTHSPEVRKLLSELNVGRISPLRGSRLSEERKTRLSEQARLRTGVKNPFYGRTHSVETKQKLAAANQGKLPPNLRAVQVGERTFKSVSDAARHHGISSALVLYRVRSSKYPTWNYFNKTDND